MLIIVDWILPLGLALSHGGAYEDNRAIVSSAQHLLEFTLELGPEGEICDILFRVQHTSQSHSPRGLASFVASAWDKIALPTLHPLFPLLAHSPGSLNLALGSSNAVN